MCIALSLGKGDQGLPASYRLDIIRRTTFLQSNEYSRSALAGPLHVANHDLGESVIPKTLNNPIYLVTASSFVLCSYFSSSPLVFFKL